MNLERILAENLLRFGGKNINKQLFVYKYLLEQGDKQAAAIALLKAQGDAYREFEAWQSKVGGSYKNVILTKTQEFIPINPEPETLEDEFYNNFVTMEKGVKNPKALQTELDNLITKLTEQGAKLNVPDGKTIIEIVSTATPSPASTAPRPGDFPGSTVPASHKKLDHDYGGNLKYDANGKPTPESVEWAKTNGNEYLATARGEAVKKYLESKLIQATIVVVPLTGQEFRQFLITAKQEGTEKVITPIGTPDIKWSVSYTAGLGVGQDMDYLKDTVEWKNIIDNAYTEMQRNAQRAYNEGPGSTRMKYPDKTKFPDDKSAEWRTEYYRLNLGLKGAMLQWALYGTPSGQIFLGVSGGWTFGNSQGDLPGLNKKIMDVVGANGDISTAIENAKSQDIGTINKGALTKNVIEAEYKGMKKEAFQTSIAPFGVDTGNLTTGDLADKGAKGVLGIDEAGRLNTTGYTRNGNLIYAQFKNAASPLFTQLTGTDVAAWLKEVNNLALSDAIYSKAGNGSFYYEQFKADFEPLLSKTVTATAKGDLKALIKAAVAAGISDTSETISTDPKYWVNAYYIDYTKMDAFNKPKRGKLTGQDAIDFFEGTKFAQ